MSDLLQNSKDEINDSTKMDNSVQIEEKFVQHCYISLFLNQTTREKIAKYQIALYEHLPKNVRDNIAWVPSAWFGITLKYLGLVSPAFVEVVYDILKKILRDRKTPFILESSGLHTFHRVSGEPRILSLGFKENEDVNDLIEKLNEKISETGYIGETVKAVPRVTLGRVVSDDITPFMSYLESFKNELINEVLLDEVIIGNRISNNYKDMPKILYCYNIEDYSLEESVNRESLLPEFIPNDNSDNLIEDIVNNSGINKAKLEELIEKEAKNSSIFSNLPVEKDEVQKKNEVYSGESMEWETIQENLQLNRNSSKPVSRDNTKDGRNNKHRNSRNNRKYGKKPYNKKGGGKFSGNKYKNNKPDSGRKKLNKSEPEKPRNNDNKSPNQK